MTKLDSIPGLKDNLRSALDGGNDAISKALLDVERAVMPPEAKAQALNEFLRDQSSNPALLRATKGRIRRFADSYSATFAPPVGMPAPPPPATPADARIRQRHTATAETISSLSSEQWSQLTPAQRSHLVDTAQTAPTRDQIAFIARFLIEDSLADGPWPSFLEQPPPENANEDVPPRARSARAWISQLTGAGGAGKAKYQQAVKTFAAAAPGAELLARYQTKSNNPAQIPSEAFKQLNSVQRWILVDQIIERCRASVQADFLREHRLTDHPTLARFGPEVAFAALRQDLPEDLEPKPNNPDQPFAYRILPGVPEETWKWLVESATNHGDIAVLAMSSEHVRVPMTTADRVRMIGRLMDGYTRLGSEAAILRLLGLTLRPEWSAFLLNEDRIVERVDPHVLASVLLAMDPTDRRRLQDEVHAHYVDVRPSCFLQPNLAKVLAAELVKLRQSRNNDPALVPILAAMTEGT